MPTFITKISRHLLWVLLATIAWGLANVSLAQDRAPSIVFILADDLGWGELGCYGQSRLQTPNLDSLASQGMRFTQHYSGAPVCAPSRCVLMTGKHLRQSSVS
jgi:arylsulfatase A-like enzyme